MPVIPLREHLTMVRGRRIRYLIGGEGPALVLCHGFISSGEEFGGRFTALAQSHTIIAPDLPGNGQSSPLAARHTAAAIAETVSRLLDDLSITRFDVGGLCLGASVACALAEQRGDDVDRLILHTPLLASDLLAARYRHQIRVLSTPGLWEMVIWLSRRRLVSDLYKRLVIGEDDIDTETADINFCNQRRADPRAAREWLRDGCMRSELAMIAQRSRPTLIVVPARDRLVDVDRIRELVVSMPHVTMVVDNDGSHGWNARSVERHTLQLESFLGQQ